MINFPNIQLPQSSAPKDREIQLFGEGNEVFAATNMRVRQEGPYVYWQSRGGTLRRKLFDQPILYATGVVLVDGVDRLEHLVLQTSTSLFLYAIGTDTITTIDNALAFQDRIKAFAVGMFLYLNCRSAGYVKYFSIEDGLFDYNAVQPGAVTSVEKVQSGQDNVRKNFETDSVWGWKVGQSVLYYSYSVPFGWKKTKITRISGNSIFTLDENENEIRIWNGFPYKEEYEDVLGGIVSQSGADVYRGRIDVYTNGLGVSSTNGTITIGAVSSASPFTVNATDSIQDIATIIETHINTDSNLSAEWNAEELSTTYWDPVIGIGPNTTYYINLTSKVTKSQSEEVVITFNDAGVSTNTAPTSPFNLYEDDVIGFDFLRLHRGYMLVDELVDGSFTVFGRPEIVTVGAGEVHRRGIVGAKLTIHPGGEEIKKRYLLSTTWMLNDADTLRPSSPDRPEGAFYIHSVIDPTTSEVYDFKPDSQLIDLISGFLPMSGGISSQFGPNQITPHTMAQIRNTLVLGGYTIERPLPTIYQLESESTRRNIKQVIEGSEVTDIKPAVQFTYTDGRKSRINVSQQGVGSNGTTLKVHSLNRLVESVTVGLEQSAASAEGFVRIVQINTFMANAVRSVLSLQITDVNPEGDTGHFSFIVSIAGYDNFRVTALRTDTLGELAQKIADAFNAGTTGGLQDPSNFYDASLTTTIATNDTVLFTAKTANSDFDKTVSLEGDFLSYKDGEFAQTTIGARFGASTGGTPTNGNNEFLIDFTDPDSVLTQITVPIVYPATVDDVGTALQNAFDGSAATAGFTVDIGDYPGGLKELTIRAEQRGAEFNGASLVLNGNNVIVIDEPGTNNTSGGEDVGEDVVPAFTASIDQNGQAGTIGTESLQLIVEQNGINIGQSTITYPSDSTPSHVAELLQPELESLLGIDFTVFTNGSVVYARANQSGTFYNRNLVVLADHTDVTINQLDNASNSDPIIYEYATYQITDPEAHGYPIRLPSGVTGLNIVMDEENVREQVELGNYITIAVPGQSVRIDKQQPIANQSSITGVVPYRFNTESSTIRFRMIIFTENGVQAGIIEDLDTVFRGYFEEIGTGIVNEQPRATIATDEGVYFQSNWGFSMARERDVTHLIRKEVYSELKQKAVSIVENHSEKEIWIYTGDGNGLIYNRVLQRFDRFSYEANQVQEFVSFPTGLYFIDRNALLETDIQDFIFDTDHLNSDLELAFALEIRPSISRLSQYRIYEITAFGSGATTEIVLDRQLDLLEGATGWEQELTHDFVSETKNLRMSGASYGIDERVIQPRILVKGLNIFALGRIQALRMRTTELPLTGKARTL